MPNIAQLHPQVVHFAVALLFLGVVLRIISLTGRLRFTNSTAALLLLIGTGAAVVSVRSGEDAHGPVERIPGLRDLVIDHERHAKIAQNFFLGVAVLELIALAMARNEKAGRYVRAVHAVSALVGFVGAHQLYEAAEHGGEIVYSYAGGPGLRSGNPKDVERLLLAGLYSQSRADRLAGRADEAARLVEEMAKRYGADTTVRILRAESLLLDRKDYAGAMAALDAIAVAPTDPRLRPRIAILKADVYLAMGQPDSARATLDATITAFPQNTRLKAKRDSIK